MIRLTDAEKKQVAGAITDAEKNTDAEIVTVLSKRADHYTFLPFLIAAIVALLVPLVSSVIPALAWYHLLAWQWAIFIILALILRTPPIECHLVPRHLRHHRAATLARCQFLAQGLHATRDGTGLLIFVSEAERYVEILVDYGISEHIANDEWEQIVNRFTAKVREGETLQGFLDCIQACGKKLETSLPATREKNELPNRLFVINY